jgi:histone-lysine N-methyltransferase SETD3
MMEELKMYPTVPVTGGQVDGEGAEPDRFKRMLEWLAAGRAKFPKLYLQYYSEDYRGVHCNAHIPEDEIILQVPLSHIMTSEVARESSIGLQICNAESVGLELRSKHTYLAVYLLTERSKGRDSFWFPFLSALPVKYRNMPIFFDEAELAWLTGSMCLDKIAERKESLRLEYDNLCRYIPSVAQFAFDDFVWARLVVISRIFGITVKGKKTDGLVPLADMLNHKRPRETKWSFDDQLQAFTIVTHLEFFCNSHTHSCPSLPSAHAC